MPFTLYIKQHKSRCSYIIEEISSHGTNFKDPIKGNASNFGTRCHILRLLLKTKQSVKADAFSIMIKEIVLHGAKFLGLP